jgi:hypothetical protein
MRSQRTFREVQTDLETGLSKLKETTDPALRCLLLREMKLLLEADGIIFRWRSASHSVDCSTDPVAVCLAYFGEHRFQARPLFFGTLDLNSFIAGTAVAAESDAHEAGPAVRRNQLDRESSSGSN